MLELGFLSVLLFLTILNFAFFLLLRLYFAIFWLQLYRHVLHLLWNLLIANVADVKLV